MFRVVRLHVSTCDSDRRAVSAQLMSRTADWGVTDPHSTAGRLLGHTICGARPVWNTLTCCDTLFPSRSVAVAVILLRKLGTQVTRTLQLGVVVEVVTLSPEAELKRVTDEIPTPDDAVPSTNSSRRPVLVPLTAGFVMLMDGPVGSLTRVIPVEPTIFPFESMAEMLTKLVPGSKVTVLEKFPVCASNASAGCPSTKILVSGAAGVTIPTIIMSDAVVANGLI